MLTDVFFMLILTIHMDSGMIYEEVLDAKLSAEDCTELLTDAWFSDVFAEGNLSCQIDGITTVFAHEAAQKGSKLGF